MDKILFISTNLGGGGAQRIISYLVNEFSVEKGYEVVLMLLRKDGNTYLNTITGNVKIINLNLKKRIRYSVFAIIKNILKIRPTICFVGLEGLNLLLSPFLFFMKLKGIKFVARESNVLSAKADTNKSWYIKLIYRLFYNKYNCVIAQSVDMKNDLVKNWYIKEDIITLINNPINVQNIKLESLKEEIDKPFGDEFNFLAVGRLSYQKGYDILLQRMYEMWPNIPFHLYILGQGALEADIKSKIEEFNLEDKVTLLGYQMNPYKYMKDCDGLILSSRHEGFPNVLLEANALGIPIFTNKCLGGINEIVIEGVNGISCDFTDKKEFQDGLNLFMNSDFDSDKIVNLTRSRYNFDIIMREYKNVFRKVVNC